MNKVLLLFIFCCYIIVAQENELLPPRYKDMVIDGTLDPILQISNNLKLKLPMVEIKAINLAFSLWAEKEPILDDYYVLLTHVDNNIKVTFLRNKTSLKELGRDQYSITYVYSIESKSIIDQYLQR